MFSDIAKADVFAGPDSPSDKWLEQPLSHSGRAAGAAAHSATLPEWLTQHSATVAERLEQPLTQPLCHSARVANAALSHSGRVAEGQSG